MDEPQTSHHSLISVPIESSWFTAAICVSRQSIVNYMLTCLYTPQTHQRPLQGVNVPKERNQLFPGPYKPVQLPPLEISDLTQPMFYILSTSFSPFLFCFSSTLLPPIKNDKYLVINLCLRGRRGKNSQRFRKMCYDDMLKLRKIYGEKRFEFFTIPERQLNIWDLRQKRLLETDEAIYRRIETNSD